jgi:hypothetical protein
VRRAQTLAATPWQDYKSFVDIGAAQGRVPVTIARAHNRLSGGGYDFMSILTGSPSAARLVGRYLLTFHVTALVACPS